MGHKMTRWLWFRERSESRQCPRGNHRSKRGRGTAPDKEKGRRHRDPALGLATVHTRCGRKAGGTGFRVKKAGAPGTGQNREKRQTKGYSSFNSPSPQAENMKARGNGFDEQRNPVRTPKCIKGILRRSGTNERKTRSSSH